MSFLAPVAFLFAATIPVVILFYLLKRKRVVKLVPSTLLWKKFLAETQASAPFQKLRHNWLLVLQILLLAFAVVALARPYLSSKTAIGRLLVVILDGSASMQSKDESPSRFEKARAEASQLAQSIQDSDQMVVLLAGPQTQVMQSPTGSKVALKRALDACTVSDGPTRLVDAFKLALSLVKDRSEAEIHLFSDGAFPALTEFENENLNLIYHASGKAARNAGIVNLDVRAHPDDPSRRAVFVNLFNASTNDLAGTLELHFEGGFISSRGVELKARQTSGEVFTVAQDQDGVFTLRLNLEDDLAVDNEVSIQSLLPQPIRVLLVTKGNRFLEKALTSAPRVELGVAPDLAEASPDVDIVVLDDVPPLVWPTGNLLAVRGSQTNWLTVTGKVESPSIVDWNTTHPILRFVGLENVQITEALAAQTPGWGQSIVDGQNAPLLLAGEQARRRLIWLAFDPLQSTWPLRVSFPIFIANALEWLNPAGAKSSASMVKAGDPLRLQIPAGTAIQTASVRRGTGPTQELPALLGDREVVFGDTLRCGIYELSAGTNQAKFCVNLLDAPETDTTPQAEIKLGRYTRVAASRQASASRELWRWAALGAFALLLWEWWYYHRRTA